VTPEETDRVCIEGVTALLLRRHWDWIRCFPRAVRLGIAQAILDVVRLEYERWKGMGKVTDDAARTAAEIAEKCEQEGTDI